MRNETVARNYAEVLFELAERHEGLEPYGEAIDLVARMLDEDGRFRTFLETPRISDADRKAVVNHVFEDRVPEMFLHFLLITIDKRRQRLLRSIAQQYGLLVDQHLGREHVDLTVARGMDDDTLGAVSSMLSRILGRTAIAHVRVRPEILGGMIARTGDTIYDGSVRRRLEGLRRRLMGAELPSASVGGASD